MTGSEKRHDNGRRATLFFSQREPSCYCPATVRRAMSPKPVILSWDNWTAPQRTPWGGRAIAALKSELAIDPTQRAWAAIGESWELSVDPTLPSHVMRDGVPCETVAALLAGDPTTWLGRAAAARGETSTELMVKLIDAVEPLSVQVHPADDDPALGPDESGKPECWVVLAAAPGAGIWLGFAAGVTPRDVEAALDRGADLTPLLRFVPVAPGKSFGIAPGTVHAIGPGVTLLEAQRVRPGKSGVTYRFWDWGRGRELHRARALAVADFGPARLPAGDSHHITFSGMAIDRIYAAQPMTRTVPTDDHLMALVAMGPLVAQGVPVLRGQTALIPAACEAVELEVPAGTTAWLVSAAPLAQPSGT